MSMLNNSPYFSGKTSDLQWDLFSPVNKDGRPNPKYIGKSGMHIIWLPKDFEIVHKVYERTSPTAPDPTCLWIRSDKPLYNTVDGRVEYRKCGVDHEEYHSFHKHLGLFSEFSAGAIILGEEVRIIATIVKYDEGGHVLSRRFHEFSPRMPDFANAIDKLYTVGYKKITGEGGDCKCVETENVWFYKNFFEQLQEPVPIIAAPVKYIDGTKVLDTATLKAIFDKLFYPTTCCDPRVGNGCKGVTILSPTQTYITIEQLYRDFVFSPYPFYIPADLVGDDEKLESFIIKKWLYLKEAHYIDTFRPPCHITAGEAPPIIPMVEQEGEVYEPSEIPVQLS